VIHDGPVPEPLRSQWEPLRPALDGLLGAFGVYSAVRDEAGAIVDFRVELVNAAACEVNELTREQQEGRLLCELFPEHRTSGLLDEYRELVESGRPLSKLAYEYEDTWGGARRIRRAFDIRASRLGDGFVASWREVSEELRQRRRAEVAERQVNDIVQRSRDGILVTDRDGVVVFANPAAEALLGRPPGGAVGYGLGVPLAGDEPFELEMLGRDGRVAAVELTAAEMTWDDAPAHVVNLRDVTERQRARAEIEDLNRLLAETQRVARVGGWRWDLAADRLRFTDEWLHIHGCDSRELSRDDLLEIAHPEDLERVLDAMRVAMAGEGSYDVEHRIVRRNDGEVRVVQAHGEVTGTDADGRPRVVVGAAWDVTDQRRTEEQLLHAQRMESIGRLAGGIAHDFNNLLMAQINACELLRLRLAEGREADRYVDQVEQCAGRAAALTRQLLAFSRKQTLRPEAVDMNRLVRSLEPMIRRLIGEDVRVVTALGEEIGLVEADPSQIEQVVLNLAVNARDAMPGGGTLTLETAEVELDGEYAGARLGVEPGRYLLLAVSDTGCGMDAATRARAFDPFFTTKPTGKGTGLGLSTVYGIVKQSRGNVWLYSEPGEGTVVKVYLPRSDRTSAPAEVRPPREAPARSGTGRILVVEDDPAVREMLEEILRDRGYEVATAGSGGEAEAVVDASPSPPDLLVTDVVLPGLTGRELAERIRERHPSVVVLYISGYTENTIAHHGGLDAGVRFLQKPFRAAALVEEVEAALAETGPDAQPPPVGEG